MLSDVNKTLIRAMTAVVRWKNKRNIKQVKGDFINNIHTPYYAIKTSVNFTYELSLS